MTETSKEVLARALLELRSLRQQLAEARRERSEPIAVVGLGCRFPGASSPDAYWRLLVEGRDATGEPPPGRWDGIPIPAGVPSVRGGYLDLDTAYGFDARFFGIGEPEARSLDPQHRLLLQVAWEALEHAAIAPDRLRGTRTGVWCGISTSEYAHLLAERTALDRHFTPGTALSFAAGRISYFLGLQGPSLAVDTACSSSLVAVHLACQSLRSGETDLALAGGVNLILSPMGHLALTRAGALSPEGRSKTFDARADGYARGEGAGVVVLRRLRDAGAAGDRVLAVIRGTAVNQDGASSGLTVPSAAAQEAVIAAALASAALDPEAVSYVEAHGTGTPLGDPIEVRALASALLRGRTSPLLLGAVKTNLGHLEAAAGVAGLIKVVLALHHGALPPTLHLREPNAAIDWTSLEVVTEPRPWPREPRAAGLSAFGASGTNAHAILTGAPAAQASLQSDAAELFVLSARTEHALASLAERCASGVQLSQASLRDLAQTAATGRASLPYVLAVVAASKEELAERLSAFARGGPGVSGRRGRGDAAAARALCASLAGASARRRTLEALAALVVAGAEPDWALVFPGPRAPAELPTYPFERVLHLPPAAHEIELRASASPLLRDHRVHGRVVVSGAVQLAMVLEAAGARGVEEVAFVAPLVLAGDLPARVRVSLGGDGSFTLERGGAVICRGRTLAATPPAPPPRDVDAIRARCPLELGGADFYGRFWPEEVHPLGPSFRTLDRLWRRDGEALARLATPAVEPRDLGACLSEVLGQLLLPLVPGFAELDPRETFVGESLARSVDHGGGAASARWAHAVLTSFDGETIAGDAALLAEDGRVLASVEGIRARRLPSPKDPRRLLLDELRARIGDGALDPQASLLELGVDSVTAMELREAVRAASGVDLGIDLGRPESVAALGDRLAALVAAKEQAR